MAVGYMVDRDENIPNTDDAFFLELQRDKPNRYNSKQVRTITSDFSKHLGSGSFGNVFKGTLEDGVKVAVKVLQETTMSLSDMIKNQFKAEVSTLCKTNHRNLVQLYGYCFEPDMKALVYEFMENGSLDSILYKKNILKWEMLWNIAIGTANGLSYLHQGCQPSIIHYDIKPSNILLDSKFSPKIGDFGLAKLLKRNITHVTVSGFRGTPKYAAPELSQPLFLLKTTYKCDVFSYGMLLFELVSRRRFRRHGEDWFPRQVLDKFANGQEEELMKDCGIEKQNIEKAKKILKLALWCLEYWPQDRPSMRDVLIFLEGRELEIPTNSFSGMTGTTSLTSQYLEACSLRVPINNNRFATPELTGKLEAGILIPHEDSNSNYIGTNRSQFASPEMETKNLKPYGEKEKPPVSTVVLKIGLHCIGCSDKIRKVIYKYKGVYDVKTELPMDLVTVHGVMDVKTLIPYLKEKLKKSVEIDPPKQEDRGKKEGGDEAEKKVDGEYEAEKKVDGEIDVPKEQVTAKGVMDVKALQSSLEKESNIKVEIVPPEKQHGQMKAGGNEGEKKESVNDEGDKKDDDDGHEAKGGDGGEMKGGKVEGNQMVEHHTYRHEYSPYTSPYVYAPQIFSDENPHACSIM